MKQVMGCCKYCRQYMSIEVPDQFTYEEINDEVSKKCSCPEAQAKAIIEENIASAEGAIKTLFEDKEDTLAMKEALIEMIRPIAEGKIGSISINKGSYKATMKPSNNGVKVSLKRIDEYLIES